MQNLRKKPTFNQLINYLEIKQPKIRYPDRTATFIRNSHYLSQFDGNLLDIEEQQKNLAKEQIRETQIRNIVSNTQATASLLRSDASQEQNRRTTEEATRVKTKRRSTQTDPETRSGETQTGDPLMYGHNPLLFDIGEDEKADEAMEEADAEMEVAREKEERTNQKILEMVSTFLGEEVKDLPYLQSTASSSNFNPNPAKPPEDPPRSRSRSKSKGRPPKTNPDTRREWSFRRNRS